MGGGANEPHEAGLGQARTGLSGKVSDKGEMKEGGGPGDEGERGARKKDRLSRTLLHEGVANTGRWKLEGDFGSR